MRFQHQSTHRVAHSLSQIESRQSQLIALGHLGTTIETETVMTTVMIRTTARFFFQRPSFTWVIKNLATCH